MVWRKPLEVATGTDINFARHCLKLIARSFTLSEQWDIDSTCLLLTIWYVYEMDEGISLQTLIGSNIQCVFELFW